MDLNFGVYNNFDGSLWWITDGTTLKEQVEISRSDLKADPRNVKKLLRCGYFLSLNAQTNESKAIFKEAEKLCKDRLALNPSDGLLLTELGKALEEMGRFEEAESTYRKSVSVASNQWQCWAGLGYFLQQSSYNTLIPDRFSREIETSYTPSQESLDYRPAGEALKKAEAQSKEAAICFDRALGLAKNEPDAFMEFAGFTTIETREKAWLRHFRGEKNWTHGTGFRR